MRVRVCVISDNKKSYWKLLLNAYAINRTARQYEISSTLDLINDTLTVIAGLNILVFRHTVAN